MKKTVKKLRSLFPAHIVITLAAMGLTNLMVYYTAKVGNSALNRTYIDMTSAIDGIIPFIPFSVLIYISAFPFWYVTYYLYARSSYRNCFRLLTAVITAKLVCGLIFILCPTTNIRPVIDASAPGGWLLGLIYKLDTPDNLFPSIHCLDSWLCLRIMTDNRRRSPLLLTAGCIFAILICISTLTTRQHVIPDVIAGILIAESSWQLSADVSCRSVRKRIAALVRPVIR